ncbi:MAG: XRE family transcriptional regulator [Desulfobacterium sp.]|nr:XRE family transcriptional regulator [Desulfobacterium sp.]
MGINNLKKFREKIMLSKAELARKAKVSSITIGRIEDGMPCRLETMRKIIHGLDKQLSDKNDFSERLVNTVQHVVLTY